MLQGKRPYWYEGQYIAPQHFQQQDIYHINHASTLFQVGENHKWGILELSLNQDALHGKIIDIERCCAIFSSGMLVIGGSKTSNPNISLQTRSFASIEIPDMREFVSLFLAVPRYSSGKDNAMSAENIDTTKNLYNHRYVVHPLDVEDLFTASKSDILSSSHITYQGCLVFDSDPDFQVIKEKYDLLKLAEFAPNHPVDTLNSHYTPPCFSIREFPETLKLVEYIKGMIANRAIDFSALKRNRGIQGAAHSVQDVMRTLILKALNESLLEIECLIEKTIISPETTYSVLRIIIARLSSFTEKWDMHGIALDETHDDRISEYHHTNIYPLVKKSCSRLEAILRNISVGVDNSLRLTLDNGTYSVEIPSDYVGRADCRYYLVVESSQHKEDIRREFEENAKISIIDDIEQLKTSAITGLKIQYQASPPEELPNRSSRFAYFNIDTTCRMWQDIIKSKDIAVYTTLASNELNLSLIKLET